MEVDPRYNKPASALSPHHFPPDRLVSHIGNYGRPTKAFASALIPEGSSNETQGSEVPPRVHPRNR